MTNASLEWDLGKFSWILSYGVGTDGGNHASTILLRNGNEGFGLLNNPNLNTLQFIKECEIKNKK